MCRFAAYVGEEISISSLVTDPIHSLIHQSYDAKERSEPLNGDGFGIGWYSSLYSDSPAMFKEVNPAWSNMNLRDIARVTHSRCIFAHVRAATVGGQLMRSNCHPFTWKNYLFMHNGTVHDFSDIRRALRSQLSDESYNMIQGTTDTEHVFALFIDNLEKYSTPDLLDVADALQETIGQIGFIKRKMRSSAPTTLNLALTDGKNLIATRYASGNADSNSLYYLQAGKYSCENGICKMEKGNTSCLVVSEPLDTTSAWQRVPENSILLIDQEMNCTFNQIGT